jgi:predicted porin
VRKNLFAIIPMAFASAAYAQSSVTIYGILDTGLLFQSANGGPGVGGKTTKDVLVLNGAGGDAGNLFGLQGKEDLGGGLHAGFVLEGAFNIGTGALQSSNTLFANKANVYLENSYGRLTLGQQLDPAYLAMGAADPRDLRHAYSAAGWWNFLQGKYTAPSGTVYESNAASYSYKMRDLSASVLYRFGNEAGSLAQGRTISTGIVYDNGTVIGSGSFLVKNDATGARDLRVWSLGAGYRIGDFTFRGLYTDYDLPEGNAVTVIGTTPRSHVIVTGAGVNWQLSPFQTLTAAYYFSENKLDSSNATSSYVVSDDYWLSKRTKLYGYVGLMSSKRGANALTNLTTAELTSGYPGMNTTTVGLGIQHRF